MLFFTRKQKQYVLLLYICGIVGGTLLFQYVYQVFNSDICIYGRILFDTKHLEYIEKGNLLFYIFQYRLKLLLLLILFSLTFVRKILHGIIIVISGVRYSILLCVLTVLNQKRTILNFIEMMMPQEILYILCCLMIFSISWNLEGEEWRTSRSSKKIKRMVVILLVYFLGVLMEVYINPYLLKLLAL